MQDYSKYIARTQLLLRTGEAKLDAAIYYHSYNNDRWDFDAFYHDDSLEKAGYSYEFIDPSSLCLEHAVVENGVFAPDGPGYRAFLFQNQEELPVAAARKLLIFARQGLPMIFAGTLPSRGAYAGEADHEIQGIVKRMLELPNVLHVETVKLWPAALEELAVTPSLQPCGESLMYAHRVAADADYYFLYNQEKYFDREEMWLPRKTIDSNISLRASGGGRKPYQLNLWSGEIKPITDYTIAGDYIHLHLTLKGNDTVAIALAEQGWYRGTVPPQKQLSEVIPLEDWKLKLISYEPGEKALNGEDLTDTKLVVYGDVMTGKAEPWTVAALLDGRRGEDISGVGIYETSIEWDCSKGLLAELDLSAVCDLYKLCVNDRYVPGANPVNPVQDITPFLREGENQIRVEVASNFFHAEYCRNYLSTNWIERKPYTAWEFGILGEPKLRLYQ